MLALYYCWRFAVSAVITRSSTLVEVWTRGRRRAQEDDEEESEEWEGGRGAGMRL